MRNKVKFFSFAKETSFYLALAFLFLASSNFFGKQGFLLAFFAVFLSLYLLFDGLKRPDFGFFLLLLFGLLYNLFTFLDHTWGFNYLFYYLFLPILGYQFAFQEEKKSGKRTLLVLFFVSVGMFLHAVEVVGISFLFNGLRLGEGQPLFRSLSGDIMSRTGLSLYLMPAQGLAVAFLFSIREFQRNRFFWMSVVLSLFVIAFGITTSSLVGNRAFLIAFAVLAVLAILNECFQIKSDAVKIIASGICFVFFLCVMFLMAGIVPDFLKSIPVFERFLTGGSNSARLDIYKIFFTNFYLYPFGGVHRVIDEYYIHNFLLDIYNFGGVFPFVIFCFLFFVAALQFAKRNASGVLQPRRRYYLYSMLSLFSIGLFEPIFQANQLTLFYFALFIGVGLYLRKPLDNGTGRISI